MSNTNENTRIINLDSIILLLIVCTGLLIFDGSFNKSSEKSKNSFSTEESFAQANADLAPTSRIQIFPESWNLKRDNLKFISLLSNPFYEDRNSELKITHQKRTFEKSGNIQAYFYRNRLFPYEKDEPPVLG